MKNYYPLQNQDEDVGNAVRNCMLKPNWIEAATSFTDTHLKDGGLYFARLEDGTGIGVCGEHYYQWVHGGVFTQVDLA